MSNGAHNSRGPWWNTTVLASAVSLVVGLAGGLIGGQLAVQRTAPTSWLPKALVAPFPPTSDEESATIAVARRATPAVVSVIVSRVVSLNDSFNPSDFFGFPFFYEAPTPPPSDQAQPRRIGGGSGFIVASNGLIVTNRHVVAAGGATFTVRTAAGQEYPATVLATDPANDIAFLKIEARDLPTVTLGSAEQLELGQTVLAIGYSLGEYPNSLTKGIISGISRDITAGDTAGLSERLEGVIQTDAAINPGNSGGPLLNLAGEVIGVNTAIDQQGQLVGFAIPIDVVTSALKSVVEQGKVSRPFLGVRYVMLNRELAQQERLVVSQGAYVAPSETQPPVLPDSPADRVGIKAGDIITGVNDTDLDQDFSLGEAIAKFGVGDTITLTVRRGEATLHLEATLAERPGE